MKAIIQLLLCICISTLCSAQNIVYDENAEIRVVGSFTGIEVTGTISLYISQGSSGGVAVSAGDKKNNDKIITEVKNGILKLSVDGGLWNGFNWADKKLKAYVTVEQLSRLDISGASFVNISSLLKTDNLNIEVSGASEVKGNINVNKLNLQLSGASTARLAGIVTEGSIEASGASVFSSYGLSFDKCKLLSSGASVSKLTVNNQFIAEASGASTIYYKGAAEAKVLSCSGNSKVKNRSNTED